MRARHLRRSAYRRGHGHAALHDRGAEVPALIVSPQSEQEIALTLSAMAALQLYGCAMPLGTALARFEVHWDRAGSEEEAWSKRFIESIYAILRTAEDPAVGRPYRGDIWRADQASDARLDAVLAKYDRRR